LSPLEFLKWVSQRLFEYRTLLEQAKRKFRHVLTDEQKMENETRKFNRIVFLKTVLFIVGVVRSIIAAEMVLLERGYCRCINHFKGFEATTEHPIR
jgi:hypothetical protein